MLSIGWTEMLVIAAIALIVVGPKDLPGMLRQVGKFAGHVRRMGNEFKAEINKAAAVDEIRDIKKSVSEPLRETRRDIEKQFNSISGDGTVKPSGAIKPSDPDAESVHDEIRAAANMPAEEADTKAAARQSMAKSVRKATGADEPQGTSKTAGGSKPGSRARGKTAAAKSGTAKSTTGRSTRAKGKTTASKPAAAKSETAKPATGKTTTTKPAAAKTGAAKSAKGKANTAKSGTKSAGSRSRGTARTKTGTAAGKSSKANTSKTRTATTEAAGTDEAGS